MYPFVRLVTYISRIQKPAAISNSIWWTEWRWSYVGFLLWNLPTCGSWEIFTDPFLDKRWEFKFSHFDLFPCVPSSQHLVRQSLTSQISQVWVRNWPNMSFKSVEVLLNYVRWGKLCAHHIHFLGGGEGRLTTNEELAPKIPAKIQIMILSYSWCYRRIKTNVTGF